MPSYASVGYIRTPMCANMDLFVCPIPHTRKVSTVDIISHATQTCWLNTQREHERWKQRSECKTANQNKEHGKEEIILHLRKKNIYFLIGLKDKKNHLVPGMELMPAWTARIRTVQAASGNKCNKLLIKLWFLQGKERKTFWRLEIWLCTSDKALLSILRLNIALISKLLDLNFPEKGQI